MKIAPVSWPSVSEKGLREEGFLFYRRPGLELGFRSDPRMVAWEELPRNRKSDF